MIRQLLANRDAEAWIRCGGMSSIENETAVLERNPKRGAHRDLFAIGTAGI